MKTLFTLLILISNLTLFSQTPDVVGNYKLSPETKDNSSFKYEFTLSQDGTFTFHYYSNIKQGIPPEVNKYGKGNWIIKNNVISFFSDKQKDFDEKYTLDFTNTKARFVTKSPRDKSDRIIKTQLKFLDSEIFWMRRIDIDKI
jgi:hypothetical protein